MNHTAAGIIAIIAILTLLVMVHYSGHKQGYREGWDDAKR